MITPIFAALLALWMIGLTLNVVRIRRQHKIRYGDGNLPLLIQAKSAHGNATETIPTALILLFCLETQLNSGVLIIGLGLLLLAGRILHGYAILNNRLRGRVIGMVLTVLVMAILALANLIVWVLHALP